MTKLVLRSFQSPGDIVMLTAAIRELHTAYPGQFHTDVRTSADTLFENNPHITRLDESDPDVRCLDMHYPLIHESNQRPYHFIHGYTQYLEQQLGLRIPVARFFGDIHLSAQERQSLPSAIAAQLPAHYWILVAGGKFDFTAKWWNPASFQDVVDQFRGKVQFVQCGEAGHWHPRLNGVVDLVGKTSTREFVSLMHHADGVVCPVTFAMHLAAAVETKQGGRGTRPCVVIAGGREPAHWEAYPGHQFLSTNGALTCCQSGGCWKSRCQIVGDGDPKDRQDVCEQPVQVTADLRIPRCMHLISADDVVRRVDLYYRGGVMSNGSVLDCVKTEPQPTSRQTASVAFRHGLGDCVYFAHLIPLYTRRGYRVQVECTPDKAILFRSAGAEVITSGAKETHPWGYPSGGTFEGHGRFWQGSKIGHNISESPLPHIGDKAELWDELCATRVDIESHLPIEARDRVRRWFDNLPRPITLLHSKGNTAQERKSLPDSIVAQLYAEFLDRCDGTLVLMDWDNRVPRLASYRIRHLSDLGACSTEVMLAMMAQANLVVGVDSGPLHAARFTATPTLGIWMPGHYPSTYALPRDQQLNVVLAEPTKSWNRWKRIPWNIVEHPGHTYEPSRLADLIAAMLNPPRYLPAAHRAADIQLIQFIGEWCRGTHGNSLASYCDRNRSFDYLFRLITRRFPQPTIVETGVIRAEEDWGGAGFFSYLAGAYLFRHGGRLHAVDISPQHCTFARSWTNVFGATVKVHQCNSLDFLREFSDAIDVLYLDSLDTTEPGHAEHALHETESALPKLRSESVIVFDDTPWNGGAWVGKGAMAVPFLLKQGWRVLYAGYQVVLSRVEAQA